MHLHQGLREEVNDLRMKIVVHEDSVGSPDHVYFGRGNVIGEIDRTRRQYQVNEKWKNTAERICSRKIHEPDTWMAQQRLDMRRVWGAGNKHRVHLPLIQCLNGGLPGERQYFGLLVETAKFKKLFSDDLIVAADWSHGDPFALKARQVGPYVWRSVENPKRLVIDPTQGTQTR